MSENTSGKYVISEYYDLSIDANLIKEAEEQGKPVIVKGILQKADTENRNGRVYPFNILKREADKYMEAVKDNRATGECVPAGTGIYTVNGWKNIEDVNIGDKIYTLNTENNNLEIQEINNTIQKNYNDDLIHIYNDTNLDMMITKKHKVVLWDRHNNPYILTGEELFNKLNENDSKVNHSYIKHSGKWTGEYSEYFTIPNSDIKIKSEDWAAFLGIFISEGHCSGTKGSDRKNIIGITQTKENSKKLIQELLDKLPFEYSITNNRQFIINNELLYNHLFELGNSSQKHIPEYAKNWSVDLLKIMFKWLLIGDGKNRKNTKGNLLEEYFTVSKQLSEDVYNIILKLGNGASISEIIPKDRIIKDIKVVKKELVLSDGSIEIIEETESSDRVIKSDNSQKLYLIHSRTTKGIYLDSRYVKSEKIPFNDNVYCVSVPNKTWLMKSDNKVSWTHNCDHPDSPIVSLINVSHKVVDMWWEGETLYGKVQLVDTPSGNILKGLLKSGVKLGISSRGIGSVKKVAGRDVVQEDFELICFDFVSSPSTPGAYLFKESKQWGMTPLNISLEKLNKENNSEENKFKKINDLSKDEFWTK